MHCDVGRFWLASSHLLWPVGRSVVLFATPVSVPQAPGGVNGSWELFERVQLAFRKDGKPETKRKRSFAHAGLVKCAHCGCSATADLHKGRYIHYRCTHKRGGCTAPLIREDRLEALLGDIVKRVRITDGDIDSVISALKASHQDERAYHEEQVNRLQGEVRKLQDRPTQPTMTSWTGPLGKRPGGGSHRNGAQGGWRCR